MKFSNNWFEPCAPGWSSGNLVRLSTNYQAKDGVVHAMQNIWFRHSETGGNTIDLCAVSIDGDVSDTVNVSDGDS